MEIEREAPGRIGYLLLARSIHFTKPLPMLMFFKVNIWDTEGRTSWPQAVWHITIMYNWVSAEFKTKTLSYSLSFISASDYEIFRVETTD